MKTCSEGVKAEKNGRSDADIQRKKRISKGHLPCFAWVTVEAAQGQKPAHVTLRSFPARQACCSSLHWKT